MPDSPGCWPNLRRQIASGIRRVFGPHPSVRHRALRVSPRAGASLRPSARHRAEGAVPACRGHHRAHSAGVSRLYAGVERSRALTSPPRCSDSQRKLHPDDSTREPRSRRNRNRRSVAQEAKHPDHAEDRRSDGPAHLRRRCENGTHERWLPRDSEPGFRSGSSRTTSGPATGSSSTNASAPGLGSS